MCPPASVPLVLPVFSGEAEAQQLALRMGLFHRMLAADAGPAVRLSPKATGRDLGLGLQPWREKAARRGAAERMLHLDAH